jgi:hypothetical protein
VWPQLVAQLDVRMRELRELGWSWTDSGRTAFQEMTQQAAAVCAGDEEGEMATSRDEQMRLMDKRPSGRRAVELMRADPSLGAGRAQVKSHQEQANEQAKKSR